MPLQDLDYSGLETGGLRLAAMIEAEVRALLADNASIRQSGALLFAGDVANIGSDAITLRYAGLDGYDAMSSASDGAEVGASQLEMDTATITVARQALRYDMTDLANLSGLPISNPHISNFDVWRWLHTNILIQMLMGCFFQSSNTKPCSVPIRIFDNKNSSSDLVHIYQKIFSSIFRGWFCATLLKPCVSDCFTIGLIKTWIVQTS